MKTYAPVKTPIIPNLRLTAAPKPQKSLLILKLETARALRDEKYGQKMVKKELRR